MRFMKDEALDAQVVRSLGKVAMGAGDVGEILAAAAKVHTLDQWAGAWQATAERLEGVARRAEVGGHHRSAGEAYLRAHEYRRQSYFFARDDLDAPHLLEAWAAQRDDFRHAMRLLGVNHRPIAIPYEGVELRGYAFIPSGAGPHPVLVALSGYHAPAEEMYTIAGVPLALARGHAVVVFDGPGQGGSLYEQRLHMRPDAEHVVGPVLDWVETQDFADPHRLSLLGRGLAGYLAPRAAAGEDRVRALIVDPGHLDLRADLAQHLPPLLTRWAQTGSTRAERIVDLVSDRSPAMRHDLLARAAAHGLTAPVDYLSEAERYTLGDRVANITCPTLVCGPEHQAEAVHPFFDALTCPRRLILFTVAEGAARDGAGAAQTLFFQRAYDWLGETLAGD